MAEMELDPAAVAKPPQHWTAHDLLDGTRTAMEEIAAKMLFIKKEAHPKSELKELITNMSLLFIALRQVNRTILLEEDRVKAETESAKAPVDFTMLQLHNLMYEKNHYMKAIKACKDFKSKYHDIELIPEEFFAIAPEDIKGKALATDPAHDLMLKRLTFELFQRKELCKLREKLEQHKRSLLETIASRKKFLSSLPSHLKTLKKASLPVLQQLGVLHTKKIKQHNAAELLPPPLYILYSQLLAQKEAFGERIELEVTGSIKDAQTFAQQQANKDNGTLMNTENSILEDDTPDDEEDGQRRRKRPKKSMVKDNVDQSGTFQSHPLKVILVVYDDEDSECKPSQLIALRFEYLVKLNVICVGIEDAEEVSDTNILCNLFPNDTGMELPHQMAKLYAEDAAYINENKTSRPYKWAQHLGGIDFLQELPPLHACMETLSSEALKGSAIHSGLSLYRHQNRVQTVVQRIRSRKKAQMALVEQLVSLAKLRLPFLIDENIPWASNTPSCTLQHWSPVGPILNYSVVAAEPVANSVGHDRDRRSVTPWEETESAREDGELPAALPAATMSEEPRKSIPNSFSELGHSRGLALITKSIAPTKMVKSQYFSKHEDDPEFMLDSESDLEEQTCLDPETEDTSKAIEEPWEDHANREFHLVLSRKDRNECIIKLEAKIKISMEYPLRPPLFSLSLSTDGSLGGAVWFNELRAMESEVNLHILKILPLECENDILAHQVCCLAMLFDFHFGTQTDKKLSTAVIDVGLCKPVSGTLLARSVRGRDRKKKISWKGMDCSQGYPC